MLERQFDQEGRDEQTVPVEIPAQMSLNDDHKLGEAHTLEGPDAGGILRDAAAQAGGTSRSCSITTIIR